ncbi:MAG: nonspecific lipid-transfer protein [Gammaproteobacteria bacterium]
MGNPREPVIVGIGRTAYSKNSGRTPLGMAVQAGREAIADAGLAPTDVEGVATFAVNDSATCAQVGYGLGLPGTIFNLDLHGGGNIAVFVVTQAMYAVQAGICDTVLVFRSLNSRSGKRFGTVTGAMECDGVAQFPGPHGYLVPGQWIAMWARRHMAKYGTTHEDLGAVAISYRRHAERNEHALSREPLTLEGYLAGRWINDPFRVYDCAREADGAVAVVVTTRERARDLPHPPIRMLGTAEYMGAGGYNDAWPKMEEMYSAHVAPRLWERSGVKPADMDFACLYDCFTYTGLVTTEDYGFCAKGEAGDFYRSGRATYGGDVVINPHGGLLSEAYIHGMNHHYEAVLQLRGGAGARQVPDARLALVSGGALGYGGAVVYARD